MCVCGTISKACKTMTARLKGSPSGGESPPARVSITSSARASPMSCKLGGPLPTWQLVPGRSLAPSAAWPAQLAAAATHILYFMSPSIVPSSALAQTLPESRAPIILRIDETKPSSSSQFGPGHGSSGLGSPSTFVLFGYGGQKPPQPAIESPEPGSLTRLRPSSVTSPVATISKRSVSWSKLRK